jgi:uncharacterized protein HemY
VLGLVIGLFVRSAVFAVIIGFAWLIAVENIITRIVPSIQNWRSRRRWRSSSAA